MAKLVLIIVSEWLNEVVMRIEVYVYEVVMYLHSWVYSAKRKKQTHAFLIYEINNTHLDLIKKTTLLAFAQLQAWTFILLMWIDMQVYNALWSLI